MNFIVSNTCYGQIVYQIRPFYVILFLSYRPRQLHMGIVTSSFRLLVALNVQCSKLEDIVVFLLESYGI